MAFHITVLIAIHDLYHDLKCKPYKQTLKANPKSKPNCYEMLQVTCLHAHRPNYYSNLLVTLYFVKYDNSIPFCKEQSYQVNKLLIDCCN